MDFFQQQLNPNSQSFFHQGINCENASTFQANIGTNGINNTNGIENSGGIISDSLSIDSGKLSMTTVSGLNQISYKSGGPTDLRDCGIEFYQPSPLTLTSDTGTMNLRAFNINIGNANQTSLVYINGTCYFYNPINMSGYINQFP